MNNAEIFKEVKSLITNYIEEHPGKTPSDVFKWMQDNIEPHLHLQNSQVRDLVFNYRKEWMLTQDSYARAHKNNSEGLPFLRANLLLNVKKR